MALCDLWKEQGVDKYIKKQISQLNIWTLSLWLQFVCPLILEF
jgi:hypothetical protein